ncbi:MAG: insulinase family protein [Bacteroidaceae bacterium]|nr:insulinase family protein [Bacteroidaceae bacterium]
MQPPRIQPVTVDDLALPRKMVMPNGVSLYLLEGVREGVVRLDILFKGGYGVQEKPLQAMFVNRMLREGAGPLSADDISSRLDYYGAWIDAYSSQGCNHMTLYTMSKHFLPLVELLEIMVKRPLFPQKNLEVLKRNNKSHFLVNSNKVDVVSQRYFENSLWGEGHKFAYMVQPEDYDAITVEDLKGYYSKVYGSGNCTLFITGDVDEAMLESLTGKFGTGEWGCGATLPEAESASPLTSYGCRKVKVEGALQGAVKIGFMLPELSAPDLYRFRFLTVLLGGYFGSRLMSNVREENGYTYHIDSVLDAYGKRYAFMISSEADNEYVSPLVEEVYKEIARIVDEPIPDAEVELVRNYVLGELCREYEERFSKSEAFINAWLSDEPFSSVNDYIETVRNVTAAELGDIARRCLGCQPMIEIISGN